jgi:hypothetical protein
MRDISAIAEQLRAIRQARAHFITLGALEFAYDLPVACGAVAADIRRLTDTREFDLHCSYRLPRQDDQ